MWKVFLPIFSLGTVARGLLYFTTPDTFPAMQFESVACQHTTYSLSLHGERSLGELDTPQQK